MLIIVGGLPGTGKSTLAHAVGDRIGGVVLNRDVIEASLWRSGIGRELESRRVANDLIRALADDLLGQSRPVILDAVFGPREQRNQLVAVATDRGVPHRLLECVCPDEVLHRSRIEGRVRGIEGWHELEWSDVQATRGRYEVWDDDRLVLDATEPFEANLADALRYLS
jgi:predicted kinase